MRNQTASNEKITTADIEAIACVACESLSVQGGTGFQPLRSKGFEKTWATSFQR